jgi:hypothetical protein
MLKTSTTSRPVAPDAAGKAFDQALARRLRRQAVQRAPLPEDRADVFDAHRPVGAAVPDRERRPRSLMRRRGADLRFQRCRVRAAEAVHAIDGLIGSICAAVGQARDDGAAGEDLGVGRQHHERHRTARREARDEHARRIEVMMADHRVDHLPDRQRLAVVPPDVVGLKPAEACERIVRPCLLGKQERELVPIREMRPARSVGVVVRRLQAAVQRDDERRARREVFRDVVLRLERSWIGAEVFQLG